MVESGEMIECRARVKKIISDLFDVQYDPPNSLDVKDVL